MLLTVADDHYKMDAHNDWETLFPRGFSQSALSLVNSSQASRATSPKVPSMYNQLWCLNELRKIYMTPGWEKDTCRDKQVHRCLNLVRQGLLCNGDTALEPTVTLGNPGPKETAETGATGYDVKHVCRDWVKIRAATEELLGQP